MVKKKENNLLWLAKSRLFKYTAVVTYLLGFGLAISDHTIMFMILAFGAVVLSVVSIYYDIKFTVKTLKGE